MPIQEPIVIRPPSREERGAFIRVSYPIVGLAQDALWFDVSAEFAHFIDDGCDAALTALLAAAMAAGRPLRIEGPVSERLLWSVRHTVSPLTQRLLPHLDIVDIEAACLRNGSTTLGDAVLTGLSCGVDSFSLIKDHLLDPGALPGFRVTHFLYAEIGHHGYGREVDTRAAVRWEKARVAGEMLARPIIRVASNTPDFYSPRWDARLNWAAALTLRTSAVPLLLQNEVRRFLFASSHEWKSVSVGPTADMTYVDPIMLPALSTDRVELFPVGTEHTRTEKTERIAGQEVVQNHLDVCIMDGRNCSRCHKCLRTLLTLEILGRLDDFADSFDLDVYRRCRSDFIARSLVDRNDAYKSEIRELIEARGFALPVATRLRAGALRAWRLIPHGLRLRVRGLGPPGPTTS